MLRTPVHWSQPCFYVRFLFISMFLSYFQICSSLILIDIIYFGIFAFPDYYPCWSFNRLCKVLHPQGALCACVPHVPSHWLGQWFWEALVERHALWSWHSDSQGTLDPHHQHTHCTGTEAGGRVQLHTQHNSDEFCTFLSLIKSWPASRVHWLVQTCQRIKVKDGCVCKIYVCLCINVAWTCCFSLVKWVCYTLRKHAEEGRIELFLDSSYLPLKNTHTLLTS